jgi:uncharacterized protein YecE (DUF72 family)
LLRRRCFFAVSFLIGTGGWAYFKVPNKSSLEAYSEVFNFVEVNNTFYEYPDERLVERWRQTVPQSFTFAVRCHQDLTHKIGLKPVGAAYEVFAKMKTYCGILKAPYLVLETPQSYKMDKDVPEAKEFFKSTNLSGVRLVWEIRAPITAQAINMMQDLNIVHSIDLSIEKPSYASDVVYSRLFGKGQMNLYQFTDEELVDIDRKILEGLASGTRIAALSYHGVRMHTDAARFAHYKKTGKFFSITPFTGTDSAKAVLAEDAKFPASKQNLIEHQGWKVVDLTADKRVHLSELLAQIPDKTYESLEEVIQVLEVKQ